MLWCRFSRWRGYCWIWGWSFLRVNVSIEWFFSYSLPGRIRSFFWSYKCSNIRRCSNRSRITSWKEDVWCIIFSLNFRYGTQLHIKPFTAIILAESLRDLSLSPVYTKRSHWGTFLTKNFWKEHTIDQF